MVLGIQWLQTLGLILLDFDRLQMDSFVMGQNHSLKFISSNGIYVVDGEEFGKLTRANHRGLILQLIEHVQLMSLTSSTEPSIQNLV